jgi:hypothetical protein
MATAAGVAPFDLSEFQYLIASSADDIAALRNRLKNSWLQVEEVVDTVEPVLDIPSLLSGLHNRVADLVDWASKLTASGFRCPAVELIPAAITRAVTAAAAFVRGEGAAIAFRSDLDPPGPGIINHLVDEYTIFDATVFEWAMLELHSVEQGIPPVPRQPDSFKRHPTGGRPVDPKTKEKHAKIERLRSQGMKWEEVAKETGYKDGKSAEQAHSEWKKRRDAKTAGL